MVVKRHGLCSVDCGHRNRMSITRARCSCKRMRKAILVPDNCASLLCRVPAIFAYRVRVKRPGRLNITKPVLVVLMVLLTLTAPAKAALEEYCNLKNSSSGGDESEHERIKKLAEAQIGSSVEHQELVEVSKFLVEQSKGDLESTRRWRVDALLKGAAVYQPPPPPKLEPVS